MSSAINWHMPMNNDNRTVFLPIFTHMCICLYLVMSVYTIYIEALVAGLNVTSNYFIILFLLLAYFSSPYNNNNNYNPFLASQLAHYTLKLYLSYLSALAASLMHAKKPTPAINNITSILIQHILQLAAKQQASSNNNKMRNIRKLGSLVYAGCRVRTYMKHDMGVHEPAGNMKKKKKLE